MGANEGEAHLISLLYDAAGQSETFAGHGSRIMLRHDPNIDAAENTRVSAARTS